MQRLESTGVSLLFLCAVLATVKATCTSVPELRGLNLRSVKNNVTGGGVHIKDGELAEGWYSAVSTTGRAIYRMSSGPKDGVPDLNQCGTLNPIYLSGSLPKLQEGKELSLEACYITWKDTCTTKLNIKARLCSGKPQYYLPAPQGISGYCFEQEVQKPPPNYVVPRPEVIPGMFYKAVLGKNNRSYKLPQLQFTCRISQDQRWFYYVQWFARVGHTDRIVQTFDLTQDLTSTKLSEERLLAQNVSLGTTISCAVSVAAEIYGAKTKATFSENFFIGIKVLTPTITIRQGRTGTLRLKQTVPFGCVYTGNNDCAIKISLYNVNQTYQCSESAVAVKDATHCGTFLAGVPYSQCAHGCPRFSEKVIEMKVLTKQSISYRMKNTFEVLLTTEKIGVDHEMWKNYRISRAYVNVMDDLVWRSRSCSSTADPQFNTFDGRFYYPNGYESLGEFVLYENTAYQIQVQYKTFKCPRNPGTCTCGVVIRAGGDLWMYNTCNNADYIGFLSCGDGILKIEETSQTQYTINTPIGTYMKVSMKSWEKYLNVNIFPSPSDHGHTRGHCGTLNGNSGDDLQTRSGRLVYETSGMDVNRFFQSWSVPSTDNYFDQRNMHLPSWNKSQLSCVCSKSSGLTSEVLCSADQTAVCHTKANQPVCNPRKKRSLTRHTRDINKMFQKTKAILETDFDRFARSAEEGNVTFSEAYTKCLEYFTARPLYSLKDTVPDARFNLSLISCANDAMVDITKTSWMGSHFESWALTIDNEVRRNITYRETRPSDLAQFQATRCIEDCSDHGRCVKGVCACDEGYAGTTCFIQKAAPLNITDIEGDGVCDISEDNECHKCLQVKSEYFLHDFHCKITVREIDLDGQSRQTDQFNNAGEYENLFEGRCCTQVGSGRRRRSAVSQGTSFVTKYLISVSNDGSNFGPPRHVYVLDSSCQDYIEMANGDLLFSIKQDTCFIGGKCFKKGQTSPVSCDNICWPETNVDRWSTGGCDVVEKRGPKKSGSDDDDDNVHLALIIPITVTGLVVLGLAAILAIWKYKRPGKLEPSPQIGRDPPPAYMNMPSNRKFGLVSVLDVPDKGTHSPGTQFPQYTA